MMPATSEQQTTALFALDPLSSKGQESHGFPTFASGSRSNRGEIAESDGMFNV